MTEYLEEEFTFNGLSEDREYYLHLLDPQTSGDVYSDNF